MYARFLKRPLDFCCALAAILALSPLLLVLTVLGAVKMHGNPFFTQPRPGKGERIFRLVKFRTMTNERDAQGNLLPDDVRLNAYGKFLRSTSLDELPELFNILQVNGRNAVTWESKIAYDLQYIEKITLLGDIRIILTTLGKVFKRDGITEEGSDTATDLGDYLLASGKITREQYDRGQQEARRLIAEAL